MKRFVQHKPLSIKNITKTRFVVGLVLGLGSSILLYLWQQYLFVLLKLMNSNFRYNIEYIISDDVLEKLSIFFAGNAVIVGNSIFIAFISQFWKRNRKLKHHLRQIRNNLSFLIGSYYFWSFKITFMILIINVFNNVDFGLTKALYFLVPFIFIALFLESVKSLRRYWRGYNLKILLIHGLIVGCLINVLSVTNTSVYNRIGVRQEQENPFVDIPVVDDENSFLLNENNSYYRFNNNIKIVKNSDSIEYRWFREKYSLREIMFKIVVSGDRYAQYGETANLYVPGDMPYYKMQEFEWNCTYHNLNKIYYMTIESSSGWHIPFRKNLYFKEDMFKAGEVDFPSPINFYPDRFKDIAKTTIKIDSFLSNGVIDKIRLEEYFYQTINKETVFDFKISSVTTLQQYIDFMNSYRKSVRLLRSEYGVLNNGKSAVQQCPHKYIETY